MTAFLRMLANAVIGSLFAPAARTATANGTGVDMLDYEGSALVILDSAAGGGTSPTLDVKLQESDTSGGTYTDIAGAAFAQVTGTASQQKLVIDASKAKRFVRAVATIGGTSPTFTCAVAFVALKKYQP